MPQPRDFLSEARTHFRYDRCPLHTSRCTCHRDKTHFWSIDRLLRDGLPDGKDNFDFVFILLADAHAVVVLLAASRPESMNEIKFQT